MYATLIHQFRNDFQETRIRNFVVLVLVYELTSYDFTSIYRLTIHAPFQILPCKFKRQIPLLLDLFDDLPRYFSSLLRSLHFHLLIKTILKPLVEKVRIEVSEINHPTIRVKFEELDSPVAVWIIRLQLRSCSSHLIHDALHTVQFENAVGR